MFFCLNCDYNIIKQKHLYVKKDLRQDRYLSTGLNFAKKD